MARKRRFGLLLAGLAGAVAVGAVVATTVTDSDSGGVKRDVIDAGGGPLAGPSRTPAPYAIKTLAPVGRAVQDPGGGGGGNGARPDAVGPPGGLDPLAQDAVRRSGLGPSIYFSGLNLLDPNRSATTSGENSFPAPTAGLADGIGAVTGQSATGCATKSNQVDYYAIPLTVEQVGFSGAPSVHLRISGSGTVTVRLYQEEQDSSCTLVSSGSATITPGATTIRLGVRRNFRYGFRTTPALVIEADGNHTISTTRQDPSYLTMPNLTGV